MFKTFVSLGWYCGTAASLAKYGGRSFSSPFDWGFFGFPGVIYALDNCFAEFLKEENLSPHYVDADGLIHVVDKKNDMDFNHEISSLEAYAKEMPAIREKYRRRIDMLYKTMERFPVCFVRCIRDEAEIAYIEKNTEYIASVISKCNERNKIIFMVPLGLDIPQGGAFQCFQLNRVCTSKGRNDLRGLFDVNTDILTYVRNNMYKSQRARNLMRDLLCEEKIGSDSEREMMMAYLDRMYRYSREDVVNCFRYILGREPRGSREIKAYMNEFSCFEELRERFLVSDEFLQKINGTTSYTCTAFKDENVTPEKVRNCYRYILGREPENEKVIEFHASRYKNVAEMRLAFLSGGEFRGTL